MKAVILYLSKHFGNQHYQRIVHWTNLQYARIGNVSGQAISLNDVNEFMVVDILKTHLETLSLPLNTFLDGVHVLPRINSTGSDFEAVLKLNHKAFMYHYERAGLSVDDIVFAHKGDKVAYTGTDAHTGYKLNPLNKTQPIMCGFINFTAGRNKGSILISQEEIEGEKSVGITNLFNGVDCLTYEEWLSSACALMFKRLLSDTSSTALLKHLKSEEVSYIRELISMSESFYEITDSSANNRPNKYISDYGRVIGHCFQRFSAMDKKLHSQAERRDNVVPISLSKTAKQAQSNDDGKTMPLTYAERSGVTGFGNF